MSAYGGNVLPGNLPPPMHTTQLPNCPDKYIVWSTSGYCSNSYSDTPSTVCNTAGTFLHVCPYNTPLCSGYFNFRDLGRCLTPSPSLEPPSLPIPPPSPPPPLGSDAILVTSPFGSAVERLATEVADGVGAAAKFRETLAIAVSTDGHLMYVSDWDQIRVIDLNTRSVRTIVQDHPYSLNIAVSRSSSSGSSVSYMPRSGRDDAAPSEASGPGAQGHAVGPHRGDVEARPRRPASAG